MEDDVKTEESSWNLAQALIMEIAKLLDQASMFYILNKMDKAFVCLKAIKLRIVQHLDKDESTKFENLEREINTNIGNYASIKIKEKEGRHMTDREIVNGCMAHKKLNSFVDEYNNLIMSCLKRYGYLIPPKEDQTKMTA